DEESLSGLTGQAAIGHTRYSTTGSSRLENAQPLRLEDPNLGWLALGHNGNITNAGPLRIELESQGVSFETTSDSEVIGKLVVASESCALMTVGAQFIREIEPGEIITIGAEGLTSYAGLPDVNQATCVFEYIYFARPDSVINNISLYTARQQMGRELAKEHPA